MRNEIRDDRLMALTVPCRYCHAPPGQECVNTWTQKPVEHIAAHLKRIRAADEGIPF